MGNLVSLQHQKTVLGIWIQPYNSFTRPVTQVIVVLNHLNPCAVLKTL